MPSVYFVYPVLDGHCSLLNGDPPGSVVTCSLSLEETYQNLSQINPFLISFKVKKEEEEQDFSQVMADPAFLESVLQTLPGVDPQSQVVKEAVGSLTQQEKDKDKEKKDKKKDEKK